MNEEKQISVNIIQQLGGYNRLKAMINIKNMVYDENVFTFSFSGSKSFTHVRITLNAMDTYDIKFFKIRGIEIKSTKDIAGIYCDRLKDIFEQETGLCLSL